MLDDDRLFGRVLTRREVLTLLGAAGFYALTGGGRGDALAAAASAGRTTVPGCVVRPEQTEGPYFVDERLERSDIRSDPGDGMVRPGVPLELAFRVSSLGAAGCAPLAGAVVDVWSCDARGIYSDVEDPGFDTTGKKFLRGFQRTDRAGVARFTTIVPGYYSGRTVHIHFKIRSAPDARRGGTFVSQLYFDDTVLDRILARAPYAERGRGRRVRNADDGIFRRGGKELILDLAAKGTGYAATFDVALTNEA